MGSKILIVLIWFILASFWVSFFSVFGIVGFFITLGLYYYIMDLRKKGKIWNKD
jgi:hypothetical protein